MKTAVSVIVPCYNVAPYVDECMSGLADQTLGPMEIICVDDGSTDGTLELLYRWREKTIASGLSASPTPGVRGPECRAGCRGGKIRGLCGPG